MATINRLKLLSFLIFSLSLGGLAGCGAEKDAGKDSTTTKKTTCGLRGKPCCEDKARKCILSTYECIADKCEKRPPKKQEAKRKDGADCINDAQCESRKCDKDSNTCVSPDRCKRVEENCSKTSECCDGLECADGEKCAKPISCVELNDPCDDKGACCKGLTCDLSAKKCIEPKGDQCLPQGGSCVNDEDCCTDDVVCLPNGREGGQARDECCIEDGNECDENTVCCGASECHDGLCGVNDRCIPSVSDENDNNPLCFDGSDCCDGICQNDLCGDRENLGVTTGASCFSGYDLCRDPFAVCAITGNDERCCVGEGMACGQFFSGEDAHNECCGGQRCIEGFCSAASCKADQETCAEDSECCSERCDDSTNTCIQNYCIPLSYSCFEGEETCCNPDADCTDDFGCCLASGNDGCLSDVDCCGTSTCSESHTCT